MKVVVVGIAAHQTTVPIGSFPVDYAEVRQRTGQIQAHVGGAGFIVARLLTALGNDVSLAAPLGEDSAAATVDAQAFRYGFTTVLCSRTLTRSPRSVILVADDGRRSVFVDLGDAPATHWELANLTGPVHEADAVVMSELRFAAPVLTMAQRAGRPVAVDLQALSGPDDPDIQEFLGADILTGSNERVRGHEHELLRALRARSPATVLVLTLAADGALVMVGDEPVHVSATAMGHLPDTSGAGEAFLASLVQHVLATGMSPLSAVRAACADAAWVLGHPGDFGAHDSHP